MPSPLGITTSGERGIIFDYKYTSPSTTNTTGSFKRIGKGDKVTQSIYNKNRYYHRPSNNDNNMQSNTPRKPHGNRSDDIYDTSIQSIINYTSNYKSMGLSETDFAYLKDLGVYPNNRLMVARRFASPVEDDLSASSFAPISTLLTWFDDSENPVKVSFSEEWEKGEGSILEILDKMLGTKALGGGLSAIDSMMKSGVPLPGFSEGLQFQILNEMGWTDSGLANVPSGNPNLIWQSMKRKIIGEGTGGSGLKSDVSIKFDTVYEQKFIGGNDPTLIYMDIINNALRFGTSESNFYINGSGEKYITDFLDKFRKGEWIDALSMVLTSITTAISKIISNIYQKGEEIIGDVIEGDADISGLVTEALSSIGGASFSKYRTEIAGVISSISGAPSTPWHITVGNPKAPIFSSGDMLCSDVSIELGETLGFNDLPTTIKISFTLKSARSLGMQEIFRKYNTGKGRVYSYVEASQFDTVLSDEKLATMDNNFKEGSEKGLAESDSYENQYLKTDTEDGSAKNGTVNPNNK